MIKKKRATILQFGFQNFEIVLDQPEDNTNVANYEY